MITRAILQRAAAIAFGLLIAGAGALADTAAVPIKPGVTFVLAVNNPPAPQGATLEGVIQGDYEMPVTIRSVGRDGVLQVAHIDGVDAQGIVQRGSIERLVARPDIERAREQVLGFHARDAKVLAGTTGLGPSLAVTRELRDLGRVEYSVRNFAAQEAASGTLSVTAPSRVKFPVLINGARRELDALRAWGRMAVRGAERPVEMYILDHPEHPLTLRVAWGPRGAGYPFEPDFAREIVRIDYEIPAVAETLEKHCRVELAGLYFDFNTATLKPESDPALREIAGAIAQAGAQVGAQAGALAGARALRLEGHTDSIGSDRYNDDLSRRRAAAVKAALVERFGVRESALSTAGYGERRPVESNDTLAGRARNRRVELVCVP